MIAVFWVAGSGCESVTLRKEKTRAYITIRETVCSIDHYQGLPSLHVIEALPCSQVRQRHNVSDMLWRIDTVNRHYSTSRLRLNVVAGT
jgi:hypothetical protein